MKKSEGPVAGMFQTVVGIWMLAVGVAAFLGWPRPFDPDAWWIPLMFCALGLNFVWRGFAPGPVPARQVLNVGLFVAVMVIYFARVPWPF